MPDQPSVTRRIAEAALKVAEFVHDGNFEGIIVSGGSHQLSHALLALGWGVRYPGERMPRTFVFDAEANKLLYKDTRPDQLGVFHPDAAGFRAWMHDHTPDLEAFRTRPLVYVDDFALSGVKYNELRTYFPREHGFTDVAYAFYAVRKGARYITQGTCVGIEDNEALAELRRLGEHIQGKEDVSEILGTVRHEAERLRAGALEHLREVGREMRGMR